MRVLHVNHSLDPVTGGGTAERTFRLARAMARAGATCEVLTLGAGLTAERVADLAPARVTALAPGSSRLSRRFALPRLGALGQVWRAVRAVDVVSLMGHWTVLNLLAYAAARLLGKPHMVCPGGALDIYGRSEALKVVYNLVAGRRLVRTAAGHVAITAAERTAFGRYGVPPAAVTVIPNGIDPDDYGAGPAGQPSGPGTPPESADVRARLAGGDHPFVLFVGRLTEIKGADLLVTAYGRAGPAVGGHHLVLVGPDEGQGAELAELAARWGVADRVHLPGPLHGSDKAAAYRAAALLAVPSRREAMSIVAVEAAVTGTPVLLTEACGFDEVATAGGGLVVPATVDGLEQGLRTLLATPAGLPAMGERLRRLVTARYTWQRAASDYARLFAGTGAGPIPAHAVPATPAPPRSTRRERHATRARQGRAPR